VEQAIRARVESVLAGAEPDERGAMLIAVLHACKLDRKAFPDADKERFKEIAEGEWAGAAVRKAIAAVYTAVTVTTIAAVAAATSVSG
jgi:hypothetical protein